ncbi:hypothetical protein RHSIM_Rhsim02G0067600 [Rhododendron simsii]|uniref:Uncharacterized protein n=1 Tax=Rhododendron simsii TaxID=118357 RepID=A0A834H9N6_RHOSS|nr:hypothetical protein RHSIM_Rhsim02G0067600 [Rhododendron simsii]
MGIHVTLLTAFSAVNRITKSADAALRGITFLGFSDGYDDGFKAGIDYEVYMADVRRRGLEAVATAITASRDNGKPIVHVVYTTLLPWVSRVARDLHVPSTFLWNQPATILDIYYYSFYGYGDVLNERKISDPSWSIELPGLPRLTGHDVPSFLLAPNAYKFALPLFKEHIDTLDEETNLKILVNSFDALELEALQAIKKLNFVAIGPLIPSAFLDGKDPSDNSFGGDLLQKSNDYIEWLDSKPRRSVIYVAFGSNSALAKQQTEEIACGLLDCGRPFLWVMRRKENGYNPATFEAFKKTMLQEFEMTNIELMAHFLGIEVTQSGEEFLSPKAGGGLNLSGYSNSDWGRDLDERKSTIGLVFFVGDTAFTWTSNKQAIVTLSSYEAEYVATNSAVCHAIWLRNVLKHLSFLHELPTEIYVDNRFVVALAKNPDSSRKKQAHQYPLPLH